MKTESIETVHCNKCGHKTNHNVVSKCSHHYSDIDRYSRYEFEWGDTYTMLECRGCSEVSMRLTRWSSEDFHEDGEDTGVFFPPRVSRRKPDWMDRLEIPEEYDGLLDEIYIALHADSRRLAMMGARALIDAIIRRQVGDVGSFKAGLDSLLEKHLISAPGKDTIEAAVNVGHASAHRDHKATENDANIVMDIVENLIHNELLSDQASTLKANTPKRGT